MIPDAEAILGAYLRGHANLRALDASVVPRTPSDTTKPWVRLTQLDAPAAEGSRSDHLIEWMGQFDCYAGKSGGSPQASELVRGARAALTGLRNVTLQGVVVTGVQILSCPRLPDTDFEPARERYVMTAIVWMHP